MALVHVSSDLTIDATTVAEVVTVSLDGIVDLATAPELREALLPLITARGTLVLDLSRVSFVDSTGLGVLVAAHRRAKTVGNSFSLARPSENLTQVLHVTRLDSVFTIENQT